MMRCMLVTALMVQLAACGTTTDEDTALGQAIDSFTGSQEFEPRFAALRRAEVPAMQVGFIEQDTSGAVLLERTKGDFGFWLSPDGAQLIFEGGILHGTRGFGEGLLGSELSQPLSLVRSLQGGQSDRFHTYLDGNDKAVTRTYRCVIENAGSRDVALGSRQVETQLMREDCRSLDQSFRNLYWVMPSSGQIVQSRQWAGPFMGEISTRIVPR